MEIKFLKISFNDFSYYPSRCHETMMLSELIEGLKAIYRQNGEEDMPVFLENRDTFSAIHPDLDTFNTEEDYEDHFADEENWTDLYDLYEDDEDDEDEEDEEEDEEDE